MAFNLKLMKLWLKKFVPKLENVSFRYMEVENGWFYRVTLVSMKGNWLFFRVS